MKNSGIEWIGEIPDDWNEIPNRYLFINHSTKVGEKANEYQLLSLTTSGVKVKDMNSTGGKVPESYESYQTVEKGDMIFCLFDLDCSAVFSGLSKYNGMITSAYDVLKPNSKYLFDLYIDYWFQYVFSNRYYKMYSKNIRYTITADMFRSLLSPVPPITTQYKIGIKLLEQSTKIEQLIENQRAQIEKLKEYKQSVITEAVTRGLDPSAPLKDSGVEWLGKIPMNWAVSRVWQIYTIILGKMLCPDKVSDDYSLEKYYCAANVHFDGISNNEQLKEMWFSSSEKAIYKVCEADLLVVEGGAGAGGCAIVKNILDNIYVQNSVMIVRSKKYGNNLYLRYYIESLVKRGYIDIVCNKATIPHFTKDKLGNMPCAVPPLEEQRQIADYLDKKCAEIDKLIAIKQQKIETLTEYKKSLIYEYVTGKKEVVS